MALSKRRNSFGFIFFFFKAFVLTIIYIILANVFFYSFRGAFFYLKMLESNLPPVLGHLISLIMPYKASELDFKFTNTLLIAIVLALASLVFVSLHSGGDKRKRSHGKISKENEDSQEEVSDKENEVDNDDINIKKNQ